MRKIEQIVIHCADTPVDMDIGAETIRRWHSDPKPEGNGWRDIGYHWVIRRDGTLDQGRKESVVGAHAGGHNRDSIGVCLVGGRGENGNAQFNFTKAQLLTLFALQEDLAARYPGSKVVGHNDLSKKPCPAFNVIAMFS